VLVVQLDTIAKSRIIITAVPTAVLDAINYDYNHWEGIDQMEW